MSLDSERTWKLVSAGAALVTGVLVRHGVRAAWRSRRGEPPGNPASPEVDWMEAVAWTASIGLAVGVGRLLARRGAAWAWRGITGEPPPEEA